MKKILSVVLSVIAAVSVCTMFSVPVLANINVYSPIGESIIHEVNDPVVNKHESNKVSGSQTPIGSNVLTFEYKGTGTLVGWSLIDKDGNEIPLSNNDPSYRIVLQEGNVLKIEVLDWEYFESPDGYTVNAIVKGDTEEGTKNDSSKSPSTGAVSVAFASVAAAGAGAVILSLSKKKDAE